MMNPFDVIPIVGSLCTIALCTRAGWAIIRRLESRAGAAPAPPAALADVDQRLTEIERSTETIAMEIERLAEAQRFIAQLLAERPAATARLDAGRSAARDAGRVITPH
ncbi:MAG: hypothetical protein JO180_08930 [Gemmatirosa sp.]|nr:hypothetical protein [Gemmatirosa sp.]